MGDREGFESSSGSEHVRPTEVSKVALYCNVYSEPFMGTNFRDFQRKYDMFIYSRIFGSSPCPGKMFSRFKTATVLVYNFLYGISKKY
jgi:hypothetical protein